MGDGKKYCPNIYGRNNNNNCCKLFRCTNEAKERMYTNSGTAKGGGVQREGEGERKNEREREKKKLREKR